MLVFGSFTSEDTKPFIVQPVGKRVESLIEEETNERKELVPPCNITSFLGLFTLCSVFARTRANQCS
ncbi:hypothetical protein OROGR_018282 [Orobanche gracilis]